MPLSITSPLGNRVARVVVAGQIPPPMGGQNVMVAQALESLGAADDLDVVHLPFHFTPDWQEHRRVGPAKVWELAAVILRLLKIRIGGPVDCLLYPFGGPHIAPLVRDLVLLPFCVAAARRVILQIHAGGIADALPGLPGPLPRLVRAVYRRCSSAIVLTEFSRIDAESLGVRDIEVVPNTLPDRYDPGLVHGRGRSTVRMLAVGHLGAPKGTPTLLRAAAALRDRGYDVSVTLLGEPLPPYSSTALEELISALELNEIVEVPGVVLGSDKWQAFGDADLFVFPSTAPESQPLVLLEAMMWQLPIVATDWRAHAEILGTPPGGVCYLPGEDSAASLERALETAIQSRHQFDEWGKQNQLRFRRHFDDRNWQLRSSIRDSVGLKQRTATTRNAPCRDRDGD
jgi:glycosyltransferase involved in cell wall biosynthesis